MRQLYALSLITLLWGGASAQSPQLDNLGQPTPVPVQQTTAMSSQRGSGQSLSLGFSILSTEKAVQPGTVILTATVSFRGTNITAAAPDTGPFTVPCGLRRGALVMGVHLIADKLKLIGKGDIKTADIKVKYSDGGGYQDADFDLKNGWTATFPLGDMEPAVKVLVFDVYYKAGRDYLKLFSFITLRASDARNRVEAARTIAFAEYDGGEDPDSIWNWQVLMGGAALTGQAVPAGGAAPLFTPSSVRQALNTAQIQSNNGGNTNYANTTPQKQTPPENQGNLVIKQEDANALIAGIGTAPGGNAKTEAPAPVAPARKPAPFQMKISRLKSSPTVRGIYFWDVTVAAVLTIRRGQREPEIVRLKRGEPWFIDLSDDLTVTRDGETLYSPRTGLVTGD